jgi:hypothetical protein
MDQSNVIQTLQKQELQIGNRKFSEMHFEMDIYDQLSGKLIKDPKGDEESELHVLLTEFIGKGKGILKITQRSSESSSTSK